MTKCHGVSWMGSWNAEMRTVGKNQGSVDKVWPFVKKTKQNWVFPALVFLPVAFLYRILSCLSHWTFNLASPFQCLCLFFFCHNLTLPLVSQFTILLVNTERDPLMLSQSPEVGFPGWFSLTLEHPESQANHSDKNSSKAVPHSQTFWVKIMFSKQFMSPVKFPGRERWNEPHDFKAKQFLKTEILL